MDGAPVLCAGGSIIESRQMPFFFPHKAEACCWTSFLSFPSLGSYVLFLFRLFQECFFGHCVIRGKSAKNREPLGFEPGLPTQQGFILQYNSFFFKSSIFCFNFQFEKNFETSMSQSEYQTYLAENTTKSPPAEMAFFVADGQRRFGRWRT